MFFTRRLLSRTIPQASLQHLENCKTATNQILKTYFTPIEQGYLQKYIKLQEKIHLKILSESFTPEINSISYIARATHDKLSDISNKSDPNGQMEPALDRFDQYWNDLPKLVCQENNAVYQDWPEKFHGGFYITVAENEEEKISASNKKLLKEFNQIYLKEHAHRCVALREGKTIHHLISEKDTRYLDWKNNESQIRKALKCPPSIETARDERTSSKIVSESKKPPVFRRKPLL